ncbi:FtsQ-type POTRA domain-containing protein [Anaerococcus sp. mt242]|uniref:cell division protein FtsQ/DivIB n=1 Tax=Anaerococcus sp. mt242 TaxID=2661917 RepID=UPI0019334802|nr:FtsQ-type POTRA domain-containing protein [Anaerococcus sp. mt242]MBM0046422.1 FtsQ-type POTRA domain-containing protein [Anaerococcus sp. mt242]
MQNSNDDRYFKKDGRTVNKKYIAKKHSKKKESKLFSKWFVFFLIMLALASIVYSIYVHSYMKISEIYITGNNITPDTEIIGQIGNPIGENILLYNAKEHEPNISKMTYIENASIKKVFPNLLNINVEEDYPLFFQNSEGKKYYISNKGTLLGESLKDFDESLLKEIKGANLRKNIGENFTGSEASLNFIRAIQKFSYFNEVKQLNLENKAEIGIMINDIDVKFGDLNDIDYKLKILDNILSDAREKSITLVSIDLGNGENPTVKVSPESYSENLNY